MFFFWLEIVCDDRGGGGGVGNNLARTKVSQGLAGHHQHQPER